MGRRQNQEGDMYPGYVSPKKGLQHERGHVPKVHVPGPISGPVPTVHLVCNAHLDPVWQWRWDEGASEALATFRNAVDILDEHPSLVFCHNEAVLYQWAERLDPALFAAIRRHIEAGRWAISGGWFIQPDVNLPGTESLVRTIAEGRRYFREKFGAAPSVAYNFDSFGHSGGLPQILRLAGYDMYVHMRPQAGELALPADLYRWRGVDGTTIPAYRIGVGLYHTEHDNIEERLCAGVALALALGRDVPVFWGLGNHGGGATRRDLATIDAYIAREKRVRIVHSTPDRFYEAVRDAAATAPVHEGDLQRVFTGCYTSLSRLKRQAVASLGGLLRTEAAASAAWWRAGAGFPAEDLRTAWNLHLFNDFHDTLAGTCIEPAERDALAQYGRAEDLGRNISLESLAVLNRGSRNSPSLPVTVFHANPSLRRVPVEFECMADHRPFWKGKWRMRLFRADGREVPCQEEQPESLLPFNNWRRRVSFVDELAGVGVARYYLKAFEIKQERGHVPSVHVPGSGALPSRLFGRIDPKTGLVVRLRAGVGEAGKEILAGPLFEPLVVEDTADSWGTGRGSYRKVAGRFRPVSHPVTVEQGLVRAVTRSVLLFGGSRIIMDVVAYPSWPVLEYRFRVAWNEERRRLKLRVPTALASAALFCEIPGGAIRRPADGEEHVHGRWLVIESDPFAIGIASCGQHGLDMKNGELRLSVLRSSAYCHEQGFDLKPGTRTSGTCPQWKFADIGIHEFRFLVTAGTPASVRAIMPGLADHLAAPPAAYAHLPFDAETTQPRENLLTLKPASVRLLACKLSWDGEALIVRLQEAVGRKTKAELKVVRLADGSGTRPSRLGTAREGCTSGTCPRSRGKHAPRGSGLPGRAVPPVHIPLAFAPFEIKTLRIEKDGTWREAALIEEFPV